MLRKTVLSLKSPTGAFIAPLRCANANLSGRGPSILLRKTVLLLKSPTGAFIAPLRKRALLKTRHFRQGARKRNENFGEKRELDDSFYLFVFYQQRLIGFQFHIRQPDGSALRGVILTTQSV